MGTYYQKNYWKQLTNASSSKKIWNSSQWLLSVCGEEEEDRKHWLPCSKTCCLVLVHLDKLCDFLIEITNLRITPNEASELCAIINFIRFTWLNTLVAYPCMLKYAIWNLLFTEQFLCCIRDWNVYRQQHFWDRHFIGQTYQYWDWTWPT